MCNLSCCNFLYHVFDTINVMWQFDIEFKTWSVLVYHDQISMQSELIITTIRSMTWHCSLVEMWHWYKANTRIHTGTSTTESVQVWSVYFHSEEADKMAFFEQSDIYWKPATQASVLYDQLSTKKYWREITEKRNTVSVKLYLVSCTWRRSLWRNDFIMQIFSLRLIRKV